jgi:hypothetical protein
MGKSRGIQNRREREEWYHLQIVLRKRRGGKEQERRGVGNTDEKGYFWKFLEVLFYVVITEQFNTGCIIIYFTICRSPVYLFSN